MAQFLLGGGLMFTFVLKAQACPATGLGCCYEGRRRASLSNQLSLSLVS